MCPRNGTHLYVGGLLYISEHKKDSAFMEASLEHGGCLQTVIKQTKKTR